ncbi:MAG: hypothetical protein KA314_07645 [Chloroflexi bacterium]|nr:hypothetical protein [Chloroflexota bacterium]MBP8055701.1 hypothetical protein [Chloroflexota bacterium]
MAICRARNPFVNGVQGFAAAWQPTQTGQLNWNVAGIAIGLIVVLLVLLLGY